MIKWADYIIKSIKYQNINGKRVVINAEMHHDIKDLEKEGLWYSRNKLISLISIGNRVCRAYKTDNIWVPGPYIYAYKIDENYYLKTMNSSNEIESDEL